jgi:hypothetical protein
MGFVETMTKQIIERLKIRSVSGRGVGMGFVETMTKQIIERLKIRSVSDGSAWGWGPTRIK